MPQPTLLDQLAPWLRDRVAALRTTTRCRSFAATVELVRPSAPGTEVPEGSWEQDGRPLDRGLRVDLLCRLMAGSSGGPAAVVVVRPGHHDARSDDDVAWAGAARAAAQICAVDLIGVVILSRWGWFDLLSGRRREWKRLRIRSG